MVSWPGPGRRCWGRLEIRRRRLTGVEPRRALGQGVEQAAHRLDRMTDRLAGAHPGRRLPECRARLAAPDWRRPLFELLGRAGGRLDADLRHLQALSPVRTLDRGYAVVTGPDGAVVRDAGVLRIGDAIAVRLAAGRVQRRRDRHRRPGRGPRWLTTTEPSRNC